MSEAKSNLSNVLVQAKEAPLIITKHGEPDAVVMSYEHYRRLTERTSGLALFEGIDWSDVELEPHPAFEQRKSPFDE